MMNEKNKNEAIDFLKKFLKEKKMTLNDLVTYSFWDIALDNKYDYQKSGPDADSTRVAYAI